MLRYTLRAMEILVLIPLLSAALGAVVPLFKELVVQLTKTKAGEKFFRENPVGKDIVKGLKLERSVARPRSAVQGVVHGVTEDG